MSGSGVPRVNLPDEEWAPIPGFEDWEVSSLGRVWSRPRYRTRGGMLAAFPTVSGYLTVRLGQKNKAVHRLVALAFLGERPDGMEVRHLNGDRADARLANLAYGTHAENMQDRRRHGTDANLNKTHCPQGHPYDEANTQVTDGRRHCRECKRIGTREYMRQQRANRLR